jgi:hypothetical protein
MRCKCCNRKLPPHLILNDHGAEEDLCSLCLAPVYYVLTDHYDILDKQYAHQEHETPITHFLPDVN